MTDTRELYRRLLTGPLGRSCVAAALAIVVGASALAQSGERLLQRGFYLEAIRCDPRAAIEEYQRILDLESSSARVAAQAHVRLGICYRLSGEKALSDEHFRIVTTIYSGEKKAAELATAYLGSGAIEDPAQFMPEDLLFYAEMVEPADQVRILGEILRGTPFQNPVDYAMAGYGPGRRAQHRTRRRPDWVRGVAAVLNQGFLKEFGKVRRLAVGVPAGSNIEESHVLVLFPGESHVLPGLFQLAASAFFSPGKPVHNFPIYSWLRTGDEIHLAFGDNVVVWGRPRKLVEEALERYRSGGPSLAQNADFRRAHRTRSESLFFFYVSKEWLRVLESGLGSPDEKKVFDAVAAAFGWQDLHPLTLALSARNVSDTFSIRFQAWRREGAAAPLLSALRTPPLDPGMLRIWPRKTLALFAVRPEQTLERTRVLADQGKALAESLPSEDGSELGAAFDSLSELLREGPVRGLLEELREFAVGAVSAENLASPDSWFLILRFHDPERGEARLRDSMTAALQEILGSPASHRFLFADMKAGRESVRRHYLEPSPGTQLGYCRIGDFFIVSFSEAALRASAAASARELPPPVAWEPGASKALYARPAALLRALGPGVEVHRDLALVLNRIERALIQSEETDGSLSVKLLVPEFTRTFRRLLEAIGRRRTERARREPSE